MTKEFKPIKLTERVSSTVISVEEISKEAVTGLQPKLEQCSELNFACKDLAAIVVKEYTTVIFC